MANIVYADPFGSYVKGAELGEESAIKTGTAARAFRREDLSPEVQAWYLPHIQQQQNLQLQKMGVDLNSEIGKQLSGLLAVNDPRAVQLLQQHFQNTYGFSPQFDPDPRKAFLQANLAFGSIQPTYADPTVGWGQPNGAFSRPSTGLSPYGGDATMAQLARELQLEQMRYQLNELKNQNNPNPQQRDWSIVFDGLGENHSVPTTPPAGMYGATNAGANMNTPINLRAPPNAAAPIGFTGPSAEAYGIGKVGAGPGNTPPVTKPPGPMGSYPVSPLNGRATGAATTTPLSNTPTVNNPVTQNAGSSGGVFLGPNGERVNK